jgi:hypothetical protein
MSMTTRAACALLSRAARIIQGGADCLRACHATNGDWGDDLQTQQIHDQEVATARDLRTYAAMLRCPRAASIPRPAKPLAQGLRELRVILPEGGCANLFWPDELTAESAQMLSEMFITAMQAFARAATASIDMKAKP